MSLTVQAADTLSQVQADPDRLAQVLRILRVNALRYTPADKGVAVAPGAPGAAGMRGLQPIQRGGSVSYGTATEWRRPARFLSSR